MNLKVKIEITDGDHGYLDSCEIGSMFTFDMDHWDGANAIRLRGLKLISASDGTFEFERIG